MRALSVGLALLAACSSDTGDGKVTETRADGTAETTADAASDVEPNGCQKCVELWHFVEVDGDSCVKWNDNGETCCAWPEPACDCPSDRECPAFDGPMSGYESRPCENPG